MARPASPTFSSEHYLLKITTGACLRAKTGYLRVRSQQRCPPGTPVLKRQLETKPCSARDRSPGTSTRLQ